MHNPAQSIATTEAHPPEPKLLGLEAEGWVYVGLTLFLLIAIFVAKAPKRVTDALDKRIADTKRELEEAKAIRAEAEALLAEAKASQTAAAADAKAIVSFAEHEAAELIAKIKQDSELLVQRRTRMAEDRIAAAERSAITEVRAQAAEAAAKAAAALIAERNDADADKALVDKTISTLGQRLN